MDGEVTLAIYPENRPQELRAEVHSENMPLNYGQEGAGEVLREVAAELPVKLPGDPEAEREAAELEDLASRLEEGDW
jgi:hypothetical protein